MIRKLLIGNIPALLLGALVATAIARSSGRSSEPPVSSARTGHPGARPAAPLGSARIPTGTGATEGAQLVPEASDPFPPGSTPANPSATIRAMADLKELCRSKGISAFGDPQFYALADRLKNAGPESQKRLAERLLQAGSAIERGLAAQLLEQIGDPASEGDLSRALLGDPDPLVRRCSAHALALMRGDGALPALTEALRTDSDVGVRINAAYGLAKSGQAAGVEGLLGLQQSPEAQPFRPQILGALADVASPTTAPMFRTMLGDSTDVGTSLAAIHALERMKDTGSLPLLATLIQNGTTPDSVRSEAQKAYNAIFGSEIYGK